MTSTIQLISFVFGIVMSLFVIYLFVGVISKARWLQLRWKRSVLPVSRLSRLAFALLLSLFAVEAFICALKGEKAVQEHPIVLVLAFAVFFALIEVAHRRDVRNYRRNHDNIA